MKKLFLVFSAVLLTAISANVFAQNTGLLPSVGSSHDYWVNKTVLGDHDATHVGNSYKWWVSNDNTDLTNFLTDDDTYFTIDPSGVTYNIAMVDSFNIGIVWNAAAVGDTFYVVVEETGNCANVKAIGVIPQNDFEVQFVALQANGTTIGDSLSRCAPDIALSAADLVVTYDYGTDTAMFKVKASGIYSGWSLDNAFDLTALGAPTTNVEYQIGAGAWNAITTTINVEANALGTEEVFLRVALDNETTNEGIAEQIIKLTLSNVTDGSNGATITDATGDDITAEPVQLQTIEARPTTSGIGTD